MPHTLNLDEALIQEALAIAEQTSLEAVIEAALRDYIQRCIASPMLDK